MIRTNNTWQFHKLPGQWQVNAPARNLEPRGQIPPETLAALSRYKITEAKAMLSAEIKQIKHCAFLQRRYRMKTGHVTFDYYSRDDKMRIKCTVPCPLYRPITLEYDLGGCQWSVYFHGSLIIGRATFNNAVAAIPECLRGYYELEPTTPHPEFKLGAMAAVSAEEAAELAELGFVEADRTNGVIVYTSRDKSTVVRCKLPIMGHRPPSREAMDDLFIEWSTEFLGRHVAQASTFKAIVKAWPKYIRQHYYPDGPPP